MIWPEKLTGELKKLIPPNNSPSKIEDTKNIYYCVKRSVFEVILIFIFHAFSSRGVVVITSTQLHSTKPSLRFCAASNPPRAVSDIRHGDDLWQWSQLEIKLNVFRRSTIQLKQFIISCSRIWTEHGEILRIRWKCEKMREKWGPE